MKKQISRPYVPETENPKGPGVDFWHQREHNTAPRTDHGALKEDVARRRKISQMILANNKKRKLGAS